MDKQVAEYYTGPLLDMNAVVASLTHCLYARLSAEGHPDIFVRVIKIGEVYLMPQRRFDIETVDLDSHVQRFTAYLPQGKHEGRLQLHPTSVENPEA